MRLVCVMKFHRGWLNVKSASEIPEQSRTVLNRWIVLTSSFLVAFSMLLPGSGILAQTAAAAKSQAQNSRSDNQIADEINRKLMASNILRPLDLGVWVHNGTATLTGTVPNPSLKQQADNLVQSVPGVKAVDDQLGIGTVSLTAPGFPAKPQGSSVGTTSSVVSQRPSSQPGPGISRSGAGAQIGQSGYGTPQASQPARTYQRRQVWPMLTVPARTPMYVMLMQTIDSHHTQPGTNFRGMVAHNIYYSKGVIAVPRGSVVEGTVIDARPPGHLEGHPKLALQLSNVNIGRSSYVLTSSVWAERGPGKGGETASAVAGGAGFGAIAGAIAGGGPVALLGAAIGGLGGAGLSAASSGSHLVVPAESIIIFHLNAPLTVREPSMDQVRTLEARISTGVRRRRPRLSSPPPIPGAPPGGYPY